MALDPGGLFSQRVHAEPAGSDAPGLFRSDERCTLQHANMLLHAREGHMELSGEVRDRSVGAAEVLQHAAPGRVRQSGERSVEVGYVILNHLVQYIADRLARMQEETKVSGGKILCVLFLGYISHYAASAFHETMNHRFLTPSSCLSLLIVRRKVPKAGLGLAGLFLTQFLICAPLLAQVEIGRISGVVRDPSGAAVSAARVSLENPLTGRKKEAISDDQGQFRFDNVPYGAFRLHVSARGFAPSQQSIGIWSNVPLTVESKLTVAGGSTVITVNDAIAAEVANPRTETVIDESLIRFMPTVVRRDQLQTLISTSPGWNTENDGLMHIRGVDDGTLYVVGGVPIPDRVDGLFAGSFNADGITSLDLITGNIPAEFGNRSGAVVVVQPKSGLSTPLFGTMALGAGSFDSRDLSTTIGTGTKTWGFFFAGSGHQSDRFLDPVDPRNFHNNGGEGSVELRSDWHATNNDMLRFSGIVQGANFSVPNNEDQQEQAQAQRQEVRHDHESVAWQRVWSPRTLTDLALYRSHFQSQLLPSEFDTPITAGQKRHHTRQGIIGSISHSSGSHSLKAGIEASRVSINELFSFAVTDAEAAEEADISDPAMEFTRDNPFLFTQHISRGTEAVYAQDDFSPFKNLKISAGLRFDHSNLLVADHQWSPRIGVSYYLPSTHTVLRASFNRLYMPPQVENLLIASSEQARELSPFADSGGGADIRPEKLSAWEAGFAQELPKSLRLNVAYWWRHFRNIDDPNVLLGTTIIFPNSVDRARAKGLDVRLDMPIRHGFSAYFSYTNNRIVEVGPLNGGLFLEDEFIEIGRGTEFTPDHDQRNVGSFALTYAGHRGLWASFTGRYESGVPMELPDLDPDELASLPGANLVNFDTGRVKPWFVFGWSGGADLVSGDHFTMGAQIDVQNIANRDFAFNWGNPFSGTHFGYPRLIAGGLRFTFKK